MATLTATAAASGVQPRAVHAGVNSVSVEYSGSTAISPSATTILMAKIPHGAAILDAVAQISSGAATCPFDIGTSYGGSLAASAIATGGTKASTLRSTKALPLDISLSDDAAVQYKYVTVTVTPGTATTEVEAKLTVFFTMDK